MLPFFYFYLALVLISLGVNFWMIDHHDKTSPFGLMFGSFVGVFAAFLSPRWQLDSTGIRDLLQFRKKQLIAPYDQIKSVRTLKDLGKTARRFEIVTPAKTCKLDVLQADEFVAALRTHLPQDKIME